MKKLIIALVLFSGLTSFFSCSEDFEVAAPYKDITVVYGMLNMRDTAHYIRIQKAFLDESKSAISMAQTADSSFYDSLTVVMRELNGANIVHTEPLWRVDLANEGYIKEPGTFFTGPNYAYKFKRDLNPAYRYRLVVMHGNGNQDSSEINVLDTAELTVAKFNESAFKLTFTKTFPLTNTFKLRLTTRPATNIKFVEGIIRFRWAEKDLTTGVQTDKYADFLFDANEWDGKDLEVANIQMYSFLRDAMEPAPPGKARYLDSCDIYINAAGVDYLNYVNTAQIQAGGLTADQIKPLYTNIRGNDVYGLLSSRTFKFKLDIPIDSTTYDSLRSNVITAPLNIQGFSDH